MERTDWLDEGPSPADARFFMLAAIIRHVVGSLGWGEHEVGKFHAGFGELDRLVTQGVAPGLARSTGTKGCRVHRAGRGAGYGLRGPRRNRT
jgi:hypothetical protein